MCPYFFNYPLGCVTVTACAPISQCATISENTVDQIFLLCTERKPIAKYGKQASSASDPRWGSAPDPAGCCRPQTPPQHSAYNESIKPTGLARREEPNLSESIVWRVGCEGSRETERSEGERSEDVDRSPPSQTGFRQIWRRSGETKPVATGES